MKSRTSFFNVSVLRKDITRFAPVWGLYTIFMLLYLYLSLEGERSAAYFASDAPYIMQFMGTVNLIYAGLCALLLFGDLHKTRLCNALHAMPLRREGWFFTHLASGMLFCLVPNAVGLLIAAIALGQYSGLAFLWYAVVVLQFLFYFGVAAFSIQCAGNGLGAASIYALINYLSVLLSWFAVTFLEPVLFGIRFKTEKLMYYSPAVAFMETEFVDVRTEHDYALDQTKAVFRGFLQDDWIYLFIAAAVGVLFLAAALLLYRKRNLERAGDFMAVKPAASVFLLLYTLSVGAVLYTLADEIVESAQYIFLVIGFALGFFTGWMLLEKKVNVFNPKRFLGFAVFVVAFFGIIGITWLDPVGVTRYVPKTEQVEYVSISPYYSSHYRDSNCRVLQDPQDIDTIREIHGALVEARNERNENSVLNLCYTLKNGTTVERQYQVDTGSREGKLLKGYYSHMESIFGTDDVQALLMDAEYVEFNSHVEELPSMVFTDDIYSPYKGSDPKEVYGENYLEFFEERSLSQNAALAGLLDAMEKDCMAGDLAQLWEYHRDYEPLGYMAICVSQGRYTTTAVDVTVYADCENTVAYLKELAKKAQ